MASATTQRAYFPMKHLNVTQTYGVGTHVGSYAIDLGGKDTGIDPAYAPFNARVKKIWNDGHTVWIESIDPVYWANGIVAKATMSFTHDNSISNLRVGQILKQGERFYEEGTAGNATGNHIHLECAKGSFVGTGWYLNKFGFWTILNNVKPEYLLWLRSTAIVINDGGLKWKKVTEVQVDDMYAGHTAKYWHDKYVAAKKVADQKSRERNSFLAKLLKIKSVFTK